MPLTATRVIEGGGVKNAAAFVCLDISFAFCFFFLAGTYFIDFPLYIIYTLRAWVLVCKSVLFPLGTFFRSFF